jgi:hypothetical protein
VGQLKPPYWAKSECQNHGNWAVEVKTGRFGGQDLRGLLEFCRRYPAFTPLVITAPGDEETARRLGIQAISWMDFLFAGPPKFE